MDYKKAIHCKKDEEIILVVHEAFRAHMFRFFLLGLWVLIPFFFFFPLMSLGLLGIILFFVLVLPAVYLFTFVYVQWARTALVITDQRIVDIDQRGLFDRMVSAVLFQNVEDVAYRVKGITPTLLRCGSVRIKVSGDVSDIVFHRVAKPAKIQQLIQDIRLMHMEAEGEEEE